MATLRLLMPRMEAMMHRATVAPVRAVKQERAQIAAKKPRGQRDLAVAVQPTDRYAEEFDPRQERPEHYHDRRDEDGKPRGQNTRWSCIGRDGGRVRV